MGCFFPSNQQCEVSGAISVQIMVVTVTDCKHPLSVEAPTETVKTSLVEVH